MSSYATSNLRMSPEEYASRLWDWTPFNGCFERGIRIGDVDGMVEANGCFLFFDGKPGYGDIPKGQAYAWNRLVALSPKIVFLILKGDPPSRVVGMEIWRTRKRSPRVGKLSMNADLAMAKRFVRRWFLAVEGRWH